MKKTKLLGIYSLSTNPQIIKINDELFSFCNIADKTVSNVGFILEKI